MDKQSKSKRLEKYYLKYFTVVLLFAVYFLMPTNNADADSWYYASCVKYKTELFNSHHLFYNCIGLFFHRIFVLFYPKIEALNSLFIMNACFGLSTFLVFRKTLNHLNISANISSYLAFIACSSFGFMRYATDAETYVIPMFLSIVSLYFYVKKPNHTDINLYLAGLFSASAILIHEVQLWWTIAMAVHAFFIRKDRRYAGIKFSAPLLVIPFAYGLVYSLTAHSTTGFMSFLLGEYGKGGAGVDLSFNSAFLTLINSFRSFIQIHGRITVLLSQQPFPFTLAILVVLFFTIKGLFFKTALRLKRSPSRSLILFPFLGIALHLMFAFVSSGNAEFLVMLPFLVVLLFGLLLEFDNGKIIGNIGIAIFIWNLVFGIMPANQYDLGKNSTQIKITKEDSQRFYLWKNKALVENRLTYDAGFKPRGYLLSPKNTDTSTINQLLLKNKIIISDLMNEDGPLSRSSFVKGEKFKRLDEHYKITILDSFDNLSGKNFIVRIEGKR